MDGKWKIAGRRGCHGRKPSGFTLIEVVIAMCLLAFAILGLAQLQIVAIRGNAFASRITTASTLAQDSLEQLVALPYANIVDGQDNQGEYTRVWDVQDDTPGAGMKTVIVTVSCPDGQSVQLRTIVAQQ